MFVELATFNLKIQIVLEADTFYRLLLVLLAWYSASTVEFHKTTVVAILKTTRRTFALS